MANLSDSWLLVSKGLEVENIFEGLKVVASLGSQTEFASINIPKSRSIALEKM